MLKSGDNKACGQQDSCRCFSPPGEERELRGGRVEKLDSMMAY